MNISDFKRHIASLGAETQLDDVIANDNILIDAMNRALLEIARVHPKKNKYNIIHYPLEPVYYTNTLQIHKINDITTNIIGAVSLCFTVKGKGSCKITNMSNSAVHTVNFDNSSFTTYKSYISSLFLGYSSANIYIEFTGDYVYQIKNVTVYDARTGDKVADIVPYEDYIEYDLKTEISDYLCLSGKPILRDGEFVYNTDYLFYGDTIKLPTLDSGLYELEYMIKPTEVTLDTDEIDIDGNLIDLYALLVASYIYIDDDIQKSNYFTSLYQEQRALLLRKQTVPPTKNRVISNGW